MSIDTRTTVSRRQFLRIVAAAGIAGWTLHWGWLREETRVTETRLLMGTIVNLTIVGEDQDTVRAAVRAALDRMANLESILSHYVPQSQLSRLNRDGKLASADDSLLELVKQARALSALADGAYDVTIKPLVDLYQAYHTRHALPDESAIRKTLEYVDYRQIQIEGNGISFGRPGMQITLDSIAKGYIVDAGVAALKQFGFANVLVEAGGDLRADGQGAAGPWRIGVQSPRPEQLQLDTRFNLCDRAMATSGDYQQFFVSDFTQHHILDPRQGRSPSEFASATVIAPTTALADALATTLMVLGSRDGLALLKQMPDCHAYLITKDLQVIQSASL
jgi:thiamine biosynthesis lipoprotein